MAETSANVALHQFGVSVHYEPDGSHSWVVTEWLSDPNYFRRQIRLDLGLHATEGDAWVAAVAARKDAARGDANGQESAAE